MTPAQHRPILLAVNGVSKRFGGVQALDDVSFGVEQGQIAAIIGPNGAGKTTLFNLISGFLPADTGQVDLAGQSIRSLPPHRVAERGLVRTFQLVRLFDSMTVVENLMVGFHLHTKGGLWAALARPSWVRRGERLVAREAERILEKVGLLGQAHALAGSLTYGQQRLLEVARALAAGPRLLLLDEPAAGLNREETDRLSQLLAVLRDEGKTILFIEHDMNMVMKTAEKVVVLEFGRKIAEGSPAEMQADRRVLDAYLGEAVA